MAAPHFVFIPQGPGMGPVHPQGYLPWIVRPLGRTQSPACFLAFDKYLFSFSPPEKLKHHKIIFVVGKLVSGPAAAGVKVTVHPHLPAPGLGVCWDW